MTQRCCVIDNGICGLAANSGVQPVTQRCCVIDNGNCGFAANSGVQPVFAARSRTFIPVRIISA